MQVIPMFKNRQEPKLSVEMDTIQWAEIALVLSQWLRENKAWSKQIPETYKAVIAGRNAMEDVVLQTLGIETEPRCPILNSTQEV